jgi:peptidoglycan/LPS O-acetylase OafA/YrhL
VVSARRLFSFNGVSWSISTEVGFYLLFPALIYRFSQIWWWKLPGTLMLSLFMVGAASRFPSFNLSARRGGRGLVCQCEPIGSGMTPGRC